MPNQCTIHVAIAWYNLDSLGALNRQVFAKTIHTNIYTYIHTYVTRVHFLSIVGLQLRALGAQPPSEQVFRSHPKDVII